MACGNANDEGESGTTYNSLRVVDYTTGFESALIAPNSVNERNIYNFEYTFELVSNYPIGDVCTVELKWNKWFMPSWIEINDLDTDCAAAVINRDVFETQCKVPEQILHDGHLKLVFRNTLVYKDFDLVEGVTKEASAFLRQVNVRGDWTEEVYVYKCEELDQSPTECGDISMEDIAITVQKDTGRQITIDDVKVRPNNYRLPGCMIFQDLFIRFIPKTSLPFDTRSAKYPEIVISIPDNYVVKNLDVNTGFNGNDWSFYCFASLQVNCTVKGHNIILQPFERIQGLKLYSLWLISAVQAPSTTMEAAVTVSDYAFLAHSEWQNVVVDKEQNVARLQLSNPVYPTLTPALEIKTKESAIHMNVFPDNRGELGYYEFKFRNVAEDSLSRQAKFVIFFES